jgi:peptidoglycan L-alanyl-D-glutamate endopeptidase CwlK
MPKFSEASLKKLNTVDPRLQFLLKEAILRVDFSIVAGHRNEADQNEAYRAKKSTKMWPNSKHNKLPSMAVDIAPYPIDWTDKAAFAYLQGYIRRIADELGIKIVWGGDWNGNWRTEDERLVDMPHIELEL